MNARVYTRSRVGVAGASESDDAGLLSGLVVI